MSYELPRSEGLTSRHEASNGSNHCLAELFVASLQFLFGMGREIPLPVTPRKGSSVHALRFSHARQHQTRMEEETAITIIRTLGWSRRREISLGCLLHSTVA
jgi:hypothetical protein